ncbi:hypothetical protein Tco_0680514 [Tanacetum coccineum]|uniref:Monodehydroascorbate reductase n=1 Tax=Tanacetum coccineum TaxID=301880 RepID=A0ABQ4XM64_9ASTR
MSFITAQQAKLDLELAPKEKRLDIGKCNGRLNLGKTQREPTFQVVLDALALTPCYSTFLTTADVLEVYMHQFWDSIHKHDISYRVHGQDFDELPTDEVIVSFFKEHGHTREIKLIIYFVVDQMHQPWRTFATIINRSLSGKTTGLDKLRLSRAQILWGMYYKKNVDYVELLWEHFTYQINNKGYKKQEKMDDYLINPLRFISANEVSQLYGARLPESMTSPEMRETKAYKIYLGYATGVTPLKKAIRDTLSVFVSKKKAHAKADRGKGIELLLDATLLEDAQLKKAIKKSRQETHKLQVSGSSEGANFESKVPDESKAKSSDTRDGEDDNKSDDNNDEGSESDDDGGNDAQDSERTDSDEEENPNLNLNIDKEEETQEKEYVHSTDYYVPTNEETDDENKEFDDEEYDDLYKDVNMRSKVTKHEEVGKGDVDMTNATRESGSKEKSYKQVVEDAHVTLTTSQKTEGSKQSSFVSSDFVSKFLILDNVPPVVNEVTSLMNVKVRQEESSTQAPPLLLVHSTPTPKPTTEPSTTLIPALPDFYSLFGFDHRVSTLEKELSQVKQVDHSAQIFTSIRSQILAMMDDHLSTRIGFATQMVLQSYTSEIKKKAQEEKDRYIDLVEKSIKDIIKDEIKSQLPRILPKEVSDTATSLTEFELKKILLDKIHKIKSYQAAPEHKELYKALVKSYKLDKEVFESYGNTYSLKRARDDKDNDEDPSARSNRGLKKRKTSKDYEPTKVILVENRLTNLSSDDVSDFALAIQMYTRSMVIQERVKDLQPGVKSYQKRINVTKLETTRLGIRKRDPCTPYTDPQGFIYVDNQGRNRLMRSDELYKFSDGTLTRVRTLLDDITKNIEMEYLPQRR